MMNDAPRIVLCPKCGKEKWHRYGLKPGEPEPPCFDCENRAALEGGKQ